MSEDLSVKEVEAILEDFEKNGLVYKRWDIRKNDYVWHTTEFGGEVAKELGLDENTL